MSDTCWFFKSPLKLFTALLKEYDSLRAFSYLEAEYKSKQITCLITMFTEKRGSFVSSVRRGVAADRVRFYFFTVKGVKSCVFVCEDDQLLPQQSKQEVSLLRDKRFSLALPVFQKREFLSIHPSLDLSVITEVIHRFEFGM